MLIIYHGRRPYLPLLACAVHLGLDSRADTFLPGALEFDWRARPLRLMGTDASGASVLCLIHGRHHGLYRRAVAGLTEIFAIPAALLCVDDAIREADAAVKLSALLAGILPDIFHPVCRSRLAAVVRPHLLVS